MKKNIFEIVNEKELNFVLSSKARENIKSNYQLNEVGIFIHLYYMEDLEGYLNYIKNIPQGIDIYISVVSQELEQRIEEYLQKWNIQNCHIMLRENRGRDISALLVTFRKIILQYRYVCFVHDKKTKYKSIDEKETAMWIRSMWENTLLSESYIYNVLSLLEQNKSLGLLVPPEVGGKDLAFVSSSALWEHNNFSNTLELAKELNLDCNISYEYPPITLGTVFWCKTAALKALWEKEWKYEDFQEEPMPDEGTISHAIERILGYVAQDAGYETGYILSDQFAKSYILQLKTDIRRNRDMFKKAEGVTRGSTRLMMILACRKREILRYMNKYQKVYFYGAGVMGRMCYEVVMREDKKPCGFIVSAKADGQREYLGVPLYTLDEIEVNENIGIIITVGIMYTTEIAERLEMYGITNYLEISGESPYDTNTPRDIEANSNDPIGTVN